MGKDQLMNKLFLRYLCLRRGRQIPVKSVDRLLVKYCKMLLMVLVLQRKYDGLSKPTLPNPTLLISAPEC